MFDGEEPLFEQQSRENGFTSWSAQEFAEHLGYKDYNAFFKSAINRATQVCVSLGIPMHEHFQQEPETGDMRLSRFACYLAAMNGDPKKPGVAAAQAYFATFAEACRRYIEETGEFERILVRDEISEHEKSLNSTAKRAGVTKYGLFQNAGYRGLYNMNIGKLRRVKGIPDRRTPLDFMGKDELAANLFRVTQTDAKIKQDKIQGQRECERAAEQVGRKVRSTMQEISGQRPEDLPRAEDIKKVRSGVNSTRVGLQKIDGKKKRRG